MYTLTAHLSPTPMLSLDTPSLIDSLPKQKQVHMKMMEMSNSISKFAQGVQQELAKRNLPSALEAVTQQDKSLPPHTKEKVRKAKQTCSAPALFELRQKCEADEDEAMSLIQVIMAMLNEEGDKDKALLRDVPSAKLSSMKTSMTLQVSSNSCSTRQQHPPAPLTTPPFLPCSRHYDRR
jgi:hypothetical protein